MPAPAPVPGLAPAPVRECPTEAVEAAAAAARPVPAPAPALAVADVSMSREFVWSTYRVMAEAWLTAVLPHLSIPDSCRRRYTGTLRCNAASCRRSCTDGAAATRTHTPMLHHPSE